jgi:hypothetical protein
MMSYGIKVSIGGRDYRRLMSCCFLKDGGWRIKDGKRVKYSMFGLCLGRKILLV